MVGAIPHKKEHDDQPNKPLRSSICVCGYVRWSLASKAIKIVQPSSKKKKIFQVLQKPV